MSRKVSENYFQRPPWYIEGFVMFGLWYLLSVSVLAPHLLPNTGAVTDAYLRFVTSNSTLIYKIYYGAILIHILETLAALYLCHRLQLNMCTSLKWVFSVFLFGIFSLWKLITVYNT